MRLDFAAIGLSFFAMSVLAVAGSVIGHDKAQRTTASIGHSTYIDWSEGPESGIAPVPAVPAHILNSIHAHTHTEAEQQAAVDFAISIQSFLALSSERDVEKLLQVEQAINQSMLCMREAFEVKSQSSALVVTIVDDSLYADDVARALYTGLGDFLDSATNATQLPISVQKCGQRG